MRYAATVSECCYDVSGLQIHTCATDATIVVSRFEGACGYAPHIGHDGRCRSACHNLYRWPEFRMLGG